MIETKAIRKALKAELGYHSRQVSVRRKGSAIRFTVRAANVDVEKLEVWARQFENIHRCERTHEILSGGNLFVFVEVDRKVKDELAAPYVDRVKDAVTASLAHYHEGSNVLVEIEGTTLHLGHRDPYRLAIWTGSGTTEVRCDPSNPHSIKGAAYHVARLA